MNEQTTVAISIERIEEMKETLRKIMNPVVVYSEDQSEMKEAVIRNSQQHARRLFQELNAIHS